MIQRQYKIIDGCYGMEGDTITAEQLRWLLIMFMDVDPNLVDEVVEERWDGLYECDCCVAVPRTIQESMA